MGQGNAVIQMGIPFALASRTEGEVFFFFFFFFFPSFSPYSVGSPGRGVVEGTVGTRGKGRQKVGGSP